MIIFGSTMSPFVRKTVAACIEKGIDFEMKVVGVQDPDPTYREASPFAKMPAIDDDGYLLSDSSAIIHYLDAKYEGAKLIPTDPEQLGRAIWWEEFADTMLAACGGKMFFNRIVAPVFLKREGDAAMADKAEQEELPPLLDFLEKKLPDPGQFLVGESISIADLAVASPFANLQHLGFELSANKWPRTRAWVAAMLARPSFADSVAREKAFFERLESAGA